MSLLFALALGVLTSTGVWLLLRPRTFDVLLGVTLLAYAVNVYIFAMGRLKPGAPPIISKDTAATLLTHADPLPQALVLTAIVISFAMTALLAVIAIRSAHANKSEHVDADDSELPR